MEDLINAISEKSIVKFEECPEWFERYLGTSIGWNNRLIAITGARGTGKTTLVLQQARKRGLQPHEVIYISLDDVLMSGFRLVDIAAWFYKNGGKLLLLDEVHKYPNWSREIKNIYDTYSKLNIVFTGSSILELKKGEADLSRRALEYHLHNLSLREFIALKDGIKLPAFSLADVLKNHVTIARDINARIRPIMYFNEYLRYGCYPYFREDIATYGIRLLATINQVIESDVPALVPVDYPSIVRMKQLTGIIAESVPFKPNIVKLCERIGARRETLLRYLYTLDRARVLRLLFSSADGLTQLAKPEKIYLDNPNIMAALSGVHANVGTMRETFFINQLSQANSLQYTEKGDFIVNNKYLFEIGGASKTNKQIKSARNAYVIKDDIEYGLKNNIPIWLFGFLY